MSSDSSKTGGKGEGASQETRRLTGWSPAAAVALLLISFLVLPRIAEVVLAFVPQFLLGWNADQLTSWFDSSLATFLYVLLSELLTIGLLLWFIRRRKRSFAKSVALDRKPSWRDAGYMVGGLLVYFGLFVVAVLVLSQLVPLNTEQEQAIGFHRNISGTGLWLAFASLVVLPPLAEEIIFRGFLYGTLRSHHMALGWAVFTTSLLFAALHLFGAADGSLLWIAFVDTFLLSLVLCYVREKTGAIWACMGIHALKNCLVFLNLFVF